jgi:prepilin-type N-terminal cleavage/methylation domain-containing protein
MNRTQSGFTILELMMTMAILVLIISMAMPSMTGFVQRNRLSAEVRGIVGAVALARSEAISRRLDVAVLPQTPGDWASGWRVMEVNNLSAPVGNVFRQSDPFPTGYTLVFQNAATALEFNPRGVLNLPANEVITLSDGKGHTVTVHMPLSGSAYIR